MNERIDPMNERSNEELTTEDIVSAGQRNDVGPDNRRMGEERPMTSRPAGASTPGTPDDWDVTPDQPPQRSHAHTATPGVQERMSQAAASGHTSDAGQQGRVDAPLVPLLPDGEVDAYQARWDAIQTAFIDEPTSVVEQADNLVAEIMRRLAETFAQERANLERQWDRGGNVSTEDLRLALQRYRSFFQRLLSA